MTDHPKYLADGHAWACLGCGYALYPDATETGYCANVYCLLHPRARYAANADNVRRLVERCVSLERELANRERELDAVNENWQACQTALTRSEERCKELAIAVLDEDRWSGSRAAVLARAALATDGDEHG